jgi:UDP-N-acetylmuramoylalanine--D-glutamate ligase
MSSQQLHFAPSPVPSAGALLNLAPDHLDWHGTFDDYVAAKTGVWRGPIAIGNADDELVARLLGAVAGRAVRFTTGEPGADMLGVVAGHLVSNALDDHDTVLAAVTDVRPAGLHNVANALAAAGLARAYGVRPDAIAAGLGAFVPDPHRNQFVVERDGVSYVDDSKATNAHAARGSLLAYERVVWIAGGLLKGAGVTDLVREVSSRLAGVVLLGADRAEIAEALRRHAPDVPMIEVTRTDDGAMLEVVRSAAGFARPGDTVLLAPAAASYDMFTGYAARGEAFAAAVEQVAP